VAEVQTTPLVGEDFAVPAGLRTGRFVIEPLDARHNVSDRAAWTSSIDHIRATPGYASHPWPDRPMSVEENAADIATHVRDFAHRTGFAYTVLEPASGEVIGCVYFYPPLRAGYDVDVRSWVRADRAELDKPLHDLVVGWLAEAWPFRQPDYAQR
jgi:hypothetical protein